MGREPSWLRALALFVATGVLALVGVVVTINSALGHALPRVAVLSVGATPGTLSSGGGTVAVVGSVEHAATCQLKLLSHVPFAVTYSHRPTSDCDGGDFAAHITFGANTRQAGRLVIFSLVARNRTTSASAKFYVTQAGVSSALVLSAGASPSALPRGGGEVTVTGKLEHTGSCQLELLSRQCFPVVYASNKRACSTSFTAHVTVGRNPTPVQRTIAFGLVARNRTSAFVGRFYVLLAALSPPTATTVAAATTTLPAATTTLPAATTTLPPAVTVPTTTQPLSATQETSPNWSGYAVTGGPFTNVTGTLQRGLAPRPPSPAPVSVLMPADRDRPARAVLRPAIMLAGVDEPEAPPSLG